jgi:RNA polymerase sigma factor (sigma-70 family)
MPLKIVSKQPINSELETSASELSKWIEESLQGNRENLELLIKFSQRKIFNLCQKFYLNPEDAEDACQEILIKIITKLAGFDGRKASFPTWIMAIAKNHLIDLKRKKGKLEAQITGLEDYFSALDSIPDDHLADPNNLSQESRMLVLEANASCLLGMILCLDREQRLVLIIGDVLDVSSKDAADIFGISNDNFRKKLSRARQDLYSFMHQRCGLINKNNPCRCHKKAKGFAEAGWLDPKKQTWIDSHYENAAVFSQKNAEQAFDALAQKYREQFLGLPTYDTTKNLVNIQSILEDKRIKDLFWLKN